jgi:hypothetical protein
VYFVQFTTVTRKLSVSLCVFVRRLKKLLKDNFLLRIFSRGGVNRF